MPHAEVETASGGTVAADDRGRVALIAEAATARLRGRHVVVTCADCATPAEAAAPLLPSGDADFGTGGADTTGNGLSTLPERAVYFQVERARAFASRWLEEPQLPSGLGAIVNGDYFLGGCNAFYDWSTLELTFLSRLLG